MAESKFTSEELAEAKKVFDAMDQDGSGALSDEEVALALKALKRPCTVEHARELIHSVDANQDGIVQWDEFLAVLQADGAGGAAAFVEVVNETKQLIQVAGHSGLHSYAQEEMAAFATHLNQVMEDDPQVAYLLPISPDTLDLCAKVKDGVLLSKFINLVVPDTIDMRAVNFPKGGRPLSLFQTNENLNLAISAATSIGVSTVNLGATELVNGEQFPHLVLGLIWQLVKLQLLNSINLKNHPELIRLLQDGEELNDLLKLPPDQLLLRWFNYHLANAGSDIRVHNFGSDVADGKAYTVLLHQIAPHTADMAGMGMDNMGRAQKVLDDSSNLGVHPFLKAKDIVAGNRRLNLAFTAAIFNQCPGLDELTQDELEKAGLMDDDVGDSREERAFRMWINSQGIDGLYINNLFEDCKDGLALLKVMDRIEPGLVDWKQVEMKPNNKFKRVANCNYAVVLGKQLKFSLVGIGGTDICDGNKKLVLALVWQLMRHHTIKFLKAVQAKRFGGGQVTDAMIIDWANQTVQSKGRSNRMSGFHDSSLSTSHFFFDLLFAVEPRIIDSSLITAGDTEENKMLNARYAISVARKLGCTIFLLPEDIVEVKPKMIMTFVASIMAVSS